MNQHINIVWLKRDLRITDHAPLQAAIRAGQPTILLYCFEPGLMVHPNYSTRQWRFIWESLEDMQAALKPYGCQVLICHNEVLATLNVLQEEYGIPQIFSHQETGVKLTFDRDIAVKKFCRNHSIEWQEYDQDGIIRGLSNRKNWVQYWLKTITTQAMVKVEMSNFQTFEPLHDIYKKIKGDTLPKAITTSHKDFQKGGTSVAWRYLKSFTEKRSKQYMKQISKPALSRHSCSRISPYVAVGCVSLREAYQWAETAMDVPGFKFQQKNFLARLRWRSHFMQKLESEWQIEFEPTNKTFKTLDRQYDAPLFEAWAEGRTGIPMIDANMRCLIATGYTNFRMRAMLTTFATFTLWQDWKPVSKHLSRLFLDFEAGIHYGQMQMQAGLTGYNTLRIYNPYIQSEKNDSEGDFVRKWVPELAEVPTPNIFRPHLMTPMEQTFYNCIIGKDYPQPIVDVAENNRKYRNHYWQYRSSPAAKAVVKEILTLHCIPNDERKGRKNG